MNNQQAYDNALFGIRLQGYKQSSVEGKCLYRGPDSTCCAAGFNIPDELYTPGLEGRNISQIIKDNSSIRLYLQGVSTELLKKLQFCHDVFLKNSFGPPVWEQEMLAIAKNHNLIYTEPELKEINFD